MNWLPTKRKPRPGPAVAAAWRVLFACLVLVTGMGLARAGDMTVAVLYPAVSGAYAQVFDNILAGITETPNIRVVSRRLGDAPDVRGIVGWLHQEHADAVIALGQRGYSFVKSANLEQPVVVGATLISPNGVSGISLSADPEQFFKRLGHLTPPVKRVFMVYSQKNNGWLIPLAKQAAKRHNIELHAMEADGARRAVQNYKTILGEVHDLSDAIWLPLDNVAPDSVVLPMVLEAAWNKRLVVFSNNPSHVRQGALFSLFPDHRGMGQRLAQMVLALTHDRKDAPGVVPLEDLKLAVNVRTASHLGMVYSPRQERAFALVFPSR